MASQRPPLEIWSPLPPQASGIADYVHEQLEFLAAAFDITLVAEDPETVVEALRTSYRIVAPEGSCPGTLRVYHVGNSPLHASIYREALRVPGIVVLHEWNLHELLLGFAVAAHDFGGYRSTMRREHGERGSIAAGAISSALGGRHWTSVFPLNAEILERSLALVCLAGSTAARAAARAPGTPILHLPHHAVLKSHAGDRREARIKLGIDERARVVLAPGLGTTSKSLDVARAAMEAVRATVDGAILLTAGGGSSEGTTDGHHNERSLGRVDLETLGDTLLSADVVLALRFPSRGEASGVVMRALAAGRALVVSSGSTADEDLPDGVVARVNPGPFETTELAALLEFILSKDEARLRMERLARRAASDRDARSLTGTLASFINEVARTRSSLESRLEARRMRAAGIRDRIRDEVEAAASSLGLAQLPPHVFERLAGL